jgi:ClpP class serine protease
MSVTRKQNVLSTFFATEWAMEPEYLRWMTGLVLELCALTTEERASRLRAVEAERGELLEYTWNTRIRDGVAVIPITGPIAPGMDAFTYYSGGTSVARLALDFNAVLDDPRVVAILFKVKSPGGAVDSVSPMARMIYEARGRKPMAVHVGGQCCSAAYWLAAAAGDIVVDDTSRNGSIGVYSAYLDTSKYDAKNGFREVVFRSSQSPKKNLDPTTKPGADEVQMTLDALGQVFVEAAAEYRGVSVEKVLADYGQGGVRVGQAAVDAGLVDRVGSFEETLADLARHNTAQDGGFNGAVVKGQVRAAEDEDDDEDETCPEHPDEDCPEDCPNFAPDEDDDEANDKTSARERQTPPATKPPATLNEGVDTTMAETTSAGQGTSAANNSNELADLRARLEAAEATATQNATLVEQLRADARNKRLTALVAGFEGETATHLATLTHLAETAGEDSEVFKGYVAQQQALAAQIRTGDLYKEKGKGGGLAADTATDKLTALVAAEREKNPQMSESDAQNKVFAANPGLYEQYRGENTHKV